MSVIGEIAARIKGYVHEHRELPRELNVLAAEDNAVRQAKDAWNRPLDYSIVGPNSFVLISYGADGVPGGEGDGRDIVCTYRVEDGERFDNQ